LGPAAEALEDTGPLAEAGGEIGGAGADMPEDSLDGETVVGVSAARVINLAGAQGLDFHPQGVGETGSVSVQG